MIALPREIYSANQLGDLAWEIEQIISTLQQSSIRERVVQSQLPKPDIEMSSLLQSLLNIHTFSSENDEMENWEKMLVEVKNLRDEAPSIHLILSAHPEITEKLQLIDWLRKEIHSSVLCTFSVRSDICGGVVVRTASRQYDFSFRSQLNRNKKKISEIFAHV